MERIVNTRYQGARWEQLRLQCNGYFILIRENGNNAALAAQEEARRERARAEAGGDAPAIVNTIREAQVIAREGAIEAHAEAGAVEAVPEDCPICIEGMEGTAQRREEERLRIEAERLNFEQTDDIDERDMNLEGQTCTDVIMDNMDIQEYLREADTFLLIHKSSINDILCYEKSYFRNILNNRDNWFYECTGHILDNGDRAVEFGDENDAYIRLPIYKDGLNGFIHLTQVRRLLTSNNRIYYVYPDNDKDITHSIDWVNAFGSEHRMDWIGANHCQVGSKLLVYNLKICTDPERCIRSLFYR